MTINEKQGLKPSILVYEKILNSTFVPSVRGTDLGYIGEFSQISSLYRHTINAFGGYWDATFTIPGNQNDIEEWLENGLGRHVIVRDHALSIIWSGFVNRVSATLGGLSVIRGPLLNIGNYVDLIYSTVDPTTIPPTIGIRENTGYTSDIGSQTDFGLFETVLSSGGATAAAALEARNNWIAERAYPKTTQTLNLGTTGNAVVSIECAGYSQILKKYTYSSSVTGTSNVSALISDVLGGALNQVFSADEVIDTNTLQRTTAVSGSRTAWDLIKSYTALGDTSDNRWVFGVYADEIPYYQQSPTTVEYEYLISDKSQAIQSQGVDIYPWNILPAKWMFFQDLLIGRVPASVNVLREDPRAMFIESATFTAPWGLTLTGGDTDTINQRLAKMGLAGVGG